MESQHFNQLDVQTEANFFRDVQKNGQIHPCLDLMRRLAISSQRLTKRSSRLYQALGLAIKTTTRQKATILIVLPSTRHKPPVNFNQADASGEHNQQIRSEEWPKFATNNTLLSFSFWPTPATTHLASSNHKARPLIHNVSGQ